ncbi:MAG: hypothetical protein H7A19_13215 [Rhodanobacteraceae bacterium]|nr:hypothetical protein [Rhodanobacteraceae bacterium]
MPVFHPLPSRHRPLLWICFGLHLLAALPAPAQPTAFDPGFSGNGELENPFPTLATPVRDRVFQRMGLDHQQRILIAGREETLPGNIRSLYAGRLLADGSIDPTFATSGLYQSEWGDDLYVRDLAVLPDGSAYLCASSESASYLLRFLDNGALDTQFVDPVAQTAGYLRLEPFVCDSVEVLAGGRVLVAASERLGPNQYRAAVRVFLASGAPDPGFAGTGVQYLNQGRLTLAAAEQPGRGILVATLPFLGGQLQLIRLNMDGSLDDSFQPILVEDVDSTAFNGGDALGVHPDGRIRLTLPRYNEPRVSNELWPRDGAAQPDVNGFFTPASSPADRLSFGAVTEGPDGRTLIGNVLRKAPDNCRRTQHFQHLTRRLYGVSGFQLPGDTSFAPQEGQYAWYPVQPLFNFSNCNEGVIAFRDVALQRDGRILILSSIQQDWQKPMLTRLQGNAFVAAPWDVAPAAMSFPAASDRPYTTVTSDVVIVDGLGTDVQVPAYALGALLSLNYGPYRDAPLWVKNGDVLRLRTTAPAQSGQSRTASLFVGGIRGKNSWASLGDRVQADFVITASQPSLPGARCSGSALNSNCSAAIPDQGSVESSINFVNPGNCSHVGGVRVGVDLEHSYLGDLRLTLTDPNGQVFIGGSEGIVSLLNRPQANVAASAGSCALDDLLATFADDAPVEAQIGCGQPQSQPGLSGTLSPNTPLSELYGRRTTGNDGAATSGLWRLKVEDLASGDTGQLRDWSLDIECLSSAPALSDLSVEVTPAAAIVAGAPVNLSWTVTNLGPSPTSNGRFRASLPSGLRDAMENPAWGCSTSAGGSCTPAIGCFGACIGNEIDIGLSLPVGGTATVFATGTLTPLGSGMFSIGARVSTPLAIGGSRDNHPDNDQVQLQSPIERRTDLQISSISHSWNGAQLEVRVTIANTGPSLASGFSASIDLPDGLDLPMIGCNCPANIVVAAGNVVQLSGGALLPGTSTVELIAQAGWSGAGSPGTVQVQVMPDSTAMDPNPSDNQASQAISAPPPSGPLIFSNGFE